MAGMYFSAVRESGDTNVPKAMAPTAPGKKLSAAVGTNDVLNESGCVPTWRLHWIAAMLVNG
jgi:hypothetical protein